MVSLDPAAYTDPETFDGLRFYSIRKNAEGTAASRHQFTSTSPEQLHFGFGRQACPGRFFGSTAIKCIILHLLEEYDIQLTDMKAGWPENSIKGAMIFPSETAQISFKRLDKGIDS
jgi:ent-kaurene oxidase